MQKQKCVHIVLLCLLLSASCFCWSQVIVSPSMMGLSLSQTNPSIHYKNQRWTTGFHLDFLRGINTKYNYQISAGTATFQNPDRKTDSGYEKSLLVDISASLQRRLLLIGNRSTVWGSAGIAALYVDHRLLPGLHVGPIIDFRITKATKLQFSSTYLLHRETGNGIRFKAGLFGTLRNRKPTSMIKLVSVMPVSIDRDGDGVADEADGCPDVTGLASFGGCPDTDLDGIPDHLDSCALTPGFKERHGCPLQEAMAGKKTATLPVTVFTDSVLKSINVVAKNIHFANNEYSIQPTDRPHIARIAYLLSRVQFDTLYITGHTDNIGTAVDNLVLSEKRAESIRRELALLGIPSKKMVATGKGESAPIAPNNSDQGKHFNRRTEFSLTRPYKLPQVVNP